MTIESKNVDEMYLNCVRNLIFAPKVGNTHEINNVELIVEDITNPIISIRDISITYLFGELLWYFMGDNSLKFISQFSSFWNHLTDDGITCNSAYGYLMQKKYGFNQLEKVIDILKKDPNSRRAKINLNVPNINVDTTHDEICTMSLHFLVRNGKLDCTAIMRSNDIWFGLPYDIVFFTELQKIIADILGIGYGIYTHFDVSLHVYDKDFETIKNIALNPISKPYKFNRKNFYNNDLYDMASKDGKVGLINGLKKYNILEGDF